MLAPSSSIADKVTATRIRIGPVGRANLGATSLLSAARLGAATNPPKSSAVPSPATTTTPPRCSCGDTPRCAIEAPNSPAAKKPMLQNECARFMIRRPINASVRSASTFTMISVHPIISPAGISSKNSASGPGAWTAMA